ncbi:MAG: hypothetical protein GW858_09205 [Sphingomonadales bacterium]|nr:hypothetical protein [Sphingomonadales bacterium]NCQ20078.1 hypothetical protein [Sphingomonadales bacterium]NCT02489.1 hypothetical protein [Sphingomonadales bacterium]
MAPKRLLQGVFHQLARDSVLLEDYLSPMATLLTTTCTTTTRTTIRGRGRAG